MRERSSQRTAPTVLQRNRWCGNSLLNGFDDQTGGPVSRKTRPVKCPVSDAHEGQLLVPLSFRREAGLVLLSLAVSF